MPKQIATATMEGTRKRGRPRTRWTEEFEDGLNVMGVKNTDGQWPETDGN
jgi:hypothetical protein